MSNTQSTGKPFTFMKYIQTLLHQDTWYNNRSYSKYIFFSISSLPVRHGDEICY